MKLWLGREMINNAAVSKSVPSGHASLSTTFLRRESYLLVADRIEKFF